MGLGKRKEEGGGCLQQPKALSYDLHACGKLSVLPIELVSTGSRDFKKITFGFPNLSNVHNFMEPKSSVFGKVTPHTHTCATHLCSISLAEMVRRRQREEGACCWHGSVGTKYEKH